MHHTSTNRPRRVALCAAAGALVASTSLLAASGTAPVAALERPATVIDDFEDGDVSDWGFFGGNAAGGGGGVADDRPREGARYLSTGWGGGGTASGFYGGFFRNLDNGAQVAPPTDPWFNAWVLNQSNATVDRYQLEITLREDTDGNGWTNGAEDSIRLDATFPAATFDDEWTLVSAPLSSFTDLATGGNGTFDGALDEVVIVIAGVQGADPSVVEVDFDQLSFTSGGPVFEADPAGNVVVFDDMEHGDPLANGWFSFGGAVGGGGIAPNTADLPPADGGMFSLETGWGSGGVPGFYGGFGRTNPTDLTGTDTFNFWINPNESQEYTLEVNLQEDGDDEFQFDCVVGPAGPCAVSGGGWQLVSVPLSAFFDDNSFATGGDGVLGTEIATIVIAVIGSGSDANFRTDYWAFSDGPLNPDVSTVIDDFENGLPFGSTPDGELLGFYTFQGDGSVTIATSETPPAPELPEIGTPNNVMQMDVDVASFAGYIHAFENGAVDAWVTQDWSTSEGIRFWMYGNDSGTQMFIDILDNRNPGSTTDDAERWTVAFADDFTGWQLLEFPFSSFTRKEIGNGAPNDGLGLFQMHGYAIGTLGTDGPKTFLLDEVSLYGIAEPPALAVNFARQNTFIAEGTTGQVAVKLNRPMGPDDPAQVSIDFATERSNAVPGEDFTPTSGTLTFVNGGPTELTFPVETFDDTKFTGDLQVVIRLTNPVDVERGALFQGSVLIDDDDPFDPLLLDDFEQGAYLWDAVGDAEVDAERVAAGEPGARPGQDAVENVGVVSTPLAVDVAVRGSVCSGKQGAVPVHLLGSDTFDVSTVDHTTVTFGGASETHVDKRTGTARRHGGDVNRDGRDDLVFHFSARDIDCSAGEPTLSGSTHDGQSITSGGADAAIVHDFPIGQDWTGAESLRFWYEGSGSGDEITVTLKNDRAPDPGPDGWSLAWSDEFDDPAGTPPSPDNWAYEIGDTTPDGKNGWGNEELQYYTDDPDNAATDGSGNLVITLDEADGSQECYYGPCEFESARLITQNKAEFAYGRIESRLQVPTGGDGLWPAFWSLGTDITYNPWPGAGEIDIMEYVSRLPNEIFGTIHGPGYSGGGSFSGIYDFGGRVDADYHTYAVEWEPEAIRWYVDGYLYHEAAPSDVAPNPWVFEKPFFLLLNFAIGGNFGGAIDPDNVYPQQYLVDYVRVYQGPDTAERFEATFVDDVAGWQEITIPVDAFGRSAEQPAGAPDNGLNLDEVWGYGFGFPNGTATGAAAIDLVRRVQVPPPTDLVVTTLEDGVDGSLRDALARIADGGTITFDPALAGGTISLGGGQLLIDRSVTIDASTVAPLTIRGIGISRVLEVAAGATVSINDVVIRDGLAAPQGGGILNRGALTLERVTVTENVENSVGPAQFQLGGGGIYNGEGSTLDLIDSTVSDNRTIAQPGGGVYGFFGTTINVVNSTISGNVAGDVAGGLRTLGDVTVTDSVISGNTSTAWHGGGMFMTDGTVTITGTQIVDNVAPGATAGGLMVATFGAPVLVTVEASTITGNVGKNCQVEGDPTVAVLTLLGGNTIDDTSCGTP